jgi:hypothetical protein
VAVTEMAAAAAVRSLATADLAAAAALAAAVLPELEPRVKEITVVRREQMVVVAAAKAVPDLARLPDLAHLVL